MHSLHLLRAVWRGFFKGSLQGSGPLGSLQLSCLSLPSFWRHSLAPGCGVWSWRRAQPRVQSGCLSPETHFLRRPWLRRELGGVGAGARRLGCVWPLPGLDGLGATPLPLGGMRFSLLYSGNNGMFVYAVEEANGPTHTEGKEVPRAPLGGTIIHHASPSQAPSTFSQNSHPRALHCICYCVLLQRLSSGWRPGASAPGSQPRPGGGF